MEKFLVSTFVAALTLAIAPLSFAASDTGYHGQTIAGSNTLARNLPTDIIITNHSRDGIFVLVPNSPIHDMIRPNVYYHIFNDVRYGDTHIVLENPDHRAFFNGFVCRYASIDVVGYRNNYTVYIDDSAC